ncbi:sugar ABC transporter ATP-binding protein [Microbacterium halophytorum]|uniref:sugar ABC transporter ATP-binding protein n=1 Tax=Microbacterium halophytorum TaxID=2067568 RepID=UPI000CFE22EB|nr:sugar ABC transporter ATP-binding protein [Microbacterium halophytorum]
MTQLTTPSRTEPVPRLAARGVGKVFDTTRVLDDVSIEISAGEIVGLIGENGAGKSTLMDIMCGVLEPTDGAILVDGEETALDTLIDGAARGIFRVFQEQSLVARLSVAVNLCLGAEARFSTGGVFRASRARQHARSLLTELGLDYDVDRPVGEYSFGERQLLEIARAISLSRIFQTSHPVILMDEPTAALSGTELEIFFALLERLRAAGTGFVFVSHRLPELLQYSDRLYVLKDGALVDEVTPSTTEAELHLLMVGRERADDVYQKSRQTGPSETVRLDASEIASTGLQPTDLRVHAGEIVGVGGLLGSGKNQLAAALFGAAASTGSVIVDGVEMRHRIASRVKARMGYIPLHRHAEGASLGLSVSDNVNEVSLGRRAGLDIRRRQREAAEARTWTDRLRVRMRSVDQPVRTLSGGNQQKVVFAKWLSQGAEVILADNPTRGVDAGAKEEIYELLRDLTEQGAAVLLVSDDLLELIGLSDRILLMHDGAVTGEIASPKERPAREEAVVALMV